MGGPKIPDFPEPQPLAPVPDPEPDFQETPTNILSRRKKRRGRWSLRSRPGAGDQGLRSRRPPGSGSGGTGVNIPS